MSVYSPEEKALAAVTKLAEAMRSVADIRELLRVGPMCPDGPEPEVGTFGDTCLNLALKPMEFFIPGPTPEPDARPRTDDEVRDFILDRGCEECMARFELIVQLRAAKKAVGGARNRVARLGYAQLKRQEEAAA